MQKSKTNFKPRTRGGFTAIELIITATVLAIVTGVGLLGITRARETVRLSGAAREFAMYLEKARIFSIRSHADDASERATITINDDKSSYTVTLDLDGDGDLDTTTITLPSDVTFDTVETIAFDWRGRTWSTVSGVTSSNAQVSFRLGNGSDTVSIDVTGSGDVTVDSKVFDDSVPNVNLHVGDLATGATPVPTPYPIATPTPASSPDAIATPDPNLDPTATPTPIVSDPVATPTPVTSPTPASTPTPTATPTATPTPTPSQVPSVCTLKTDVSSLLSTIRLSLDGTTTVKVSHDASTSISITATSSKPSDLQVSPGGAQTVSAGGVTSFTIKSKKTIGTYTVTFSSSCGSTSVTVLVVALL